MAAFAAATVCGAFGPFFIASNRALGLALLFVCVVFAGAGFVARDRVGLDFGAGVPLTVGAIAIAFLIGIVGQDYRIAGVDDQVPLLLGVTVAMLMLGAIFAVSVLPSTAPRWKGRDFSSIFDSSFLAVFGLGLALLALINVLTGSIPLLAPNIDEARFAGGVGVFAPVFVFLIGGVQWLLVSGSLVWLLSRRPPKGTLLFSMSIGLLALLLIASRAIALVIPLTVLLAYVTLGRISTRKLIVFVLAGLILLGLAGQARIAGSDPTGEKRAFLVANGYGDGPAGQIIQSASTGPFVLSHVLNQVPSAHEFRNGDFFTSDLRQQIPGDFFGDPQAPDQWVTTEILNLDAAFGSPPTLVGGLYIDWGVPGILIGCFLVGFMLAAVYNWAKRAGTLGSLILYSYLVGYIIVSAYSYLSLKPSMLTFLGLAFILHRIELNHTTEARVDSSARPVA